MPSQNYTCEKKKVITLAYEDADTQLIELLKSFDHVIISRDNPYVLGYTNTLKRSNEKISRLETELAKINRQKKQYRMVTFLVLAVIACLIALYLFNSNIQELTGNLSQRDEKIKVLNQDLISANAKIDSMVIDITAKNCSIRNLEEVLSLNRKLIDSLNDTVEFQGILIDDLRSNISSVNSKLSYTESQLSTAKNDLKDVKRKLEETKCNLSNYQKNIAKNFPFIIKDIELANYTKNRKQVISDYGQSIYSSKARWIWFRIKYDGIQSGTNKLYYRIYDSHGVLKTSSKSPSGYTHSTQTYISKGTNVSELFGWGADSSIWRKGTYRIEIWCEDVCLKQKSFSIK